MATSLERGPLANKPSTSADPADPLSAAPQHRAWSRGFSTACTVAGAACLWAWGYVANLSVSLFPAPDVAASIGIEFSYYASQLTLLVFGIALVAAVRRWQPSMPPLVVVASAGVLALTGIAMRAVLCLPAPPRAAIVACGVANGVAGMLLTIAWGARFSLGSCAMRRMVLLSFLGGYAIYLVNLYLPHAVQTVVAIALPLVSGTLWLVDSWRRHLLTAEVWPATAGPAGGADPADPLRGEAADGSVSVLVLPWKTMLLFAVAALVGNFVSSFVMGATYDGAAVIFPGAFIVASCITLAAIPLVGNGARPLLVERLYRYDLPFAVLGMLLAMVLPARDLALPGALVAGASVFLQALVILKVTEAVQETGTSPMLAFAVGQGLIGGVVFAGNAGGRVMGELTGTDPLWLAPVCAVGVFVLFYLLFFLPTTWPISSRAHCRPRPTSRRGPARLQAESPRRLTRPTILPFATRTRNSPILLRDTGLRRARSMSCRCCCGVAASPPLPNGCL